MLQSTPEHHFSPALKTDSAGKHPRRTSAPWVTGRHVVAVDLPYPCFLIVAAMLVVIDEAVRMVRDDRDCQCGATAAMIGVFALRLSDMLWQTQSAAFR
jgi:hypothetical protein